MHSNGIPLSSPDIGEREIEAVVGVLRSQHLSLGPKVVEFEEAGAAYAGSKHAVAVSSGTGALHLSCVALGIGEGDEVVTTPFSFVASSNCALFVGAKPVFVDIHPETFDIDPDALEAAITPSTRAMVPVHVFGRPCPMPRYMEIARRHELAVIEDSCEAIGSTIDGKMAGSFGDVGFFAFYPNKQMTTGEGGLALTDDTRLAALLRSLRNQGRGEQGGWLAHERLGWNYRIPDILCALGTVQLTRMEEFVEARQRVFELYNEQLASIEEIVPPAPPRPGERVSWFVYVVTLREGESKARRDALISELNARGIGCRDYFSPIHLMPFYREMFGFREGMFPVTESVASRTIALPFFNQLGEPEVARVAKALREGLDATRGM